MEVFQICLQLTFSSFTLSDFKLLEIKPLMFQEKVSHGLSVFLGEGLFPWIDVATRITAYSFFAKVSIEVPEWRKFITFKTLEGA